MRLPDRTQLKLRPVIHEPVVPHRLAERIVPPRETTPDFTETLRKLWRHRWSILLSTLAVGCLAALIVAQMPTRYLAEARVLVGVPDPNVLNVQSIVSNAAPDAERVQDEAFAMQSRDLARTVIAQLNLAADPEINPDLHPAGGGGWPLGLDRLLWGRPWTGAGKQPAATQASDAAKGAEAQQNRMIDALLSRVDVSTLGRSHVLSVQAESANPDTASSVANALAAAYLTAQKNAKIELTDQAEKFLQSRIADLRQQVEKSDQAVEDYRRRYGLYRGASTGVTSQQLTELNTQLILAQTAKAEADSRLREAQASERSGQVSDSAPEVLRSPLIQALKQQQAEAERRLAEISASYGDQHPKMINGRAEIADIKRKIQTEMGHIVAGLRHESGAADARYQALKQNFTQLQSHMGGVNDQQIHLDALEREATVNRSLLESVLSRSKETTGEQELQRANAKLISPAAPPQYPAFPPKRLIVFLGAVAGMLLGIVIALLREGVDRTFRRSDQVETETGLPVLAMIPGISGRIPPPSYVLRKPVSPYSESLRKLYIGLQLSEPDRSPKTALFCSAVPGEGKSMIVASLGRLLASNGRRVLVIDCDWRRPTLHRLFNRRNSGGLAMLLAEDDITMDKAIYNDALSGADVMVAGELKPQSAHLLASDRMRLLLATLAKSYDLVLLDAPPVHVGAEVLTLARLVDKVVFTVRWGKTNQDTALDALKQVLEAQADVAGVVLSRVDPKRYRHYGYGRMSYQYARSRAASAG